MDRSKKYDNITLKFLEIRIIQAALFYLLIKL